MTKEIRVIGVEGLPEITPGMDLTPMIIVAAQAQGTPIQSGDILPEMKCDIHGCLSDRFMEAIGFDTKPALNVHRIGDPKLFRQPLQPGDVLSCVDLWIEDLQLSPDGHVVIPQPV